MTWATLFERADRYDADLASVRERLRERRDGDHD
jgi:hypothetical protein